MRYCIHRIFFLIPILAAVMLRFHHITEQGLFFPDESLYTISVRSAIEYLNLKVKHSLTDDQIIAHFAQTGLPIETPFYAKYGFFLLSLAWMALFGSHSYALQVMNGVLSILAIAIFFFVAKRMFGAGIPSVVAMMLLAFSSNFLLWSRRAMPMMPEMLFYIATLLFYLRSLEGEETKNAALSGVLLGCTLLTHPNSLPWLMVPVVTEGFFLLRRDNTWLRVKKMALLLGGILLVEASLEGLIMLARFWLKSDLQAFSEASVFSSEVGLRSNIALILRHATLGYHSSLTYYGKLKAYGACFISREGMLVFLLYLTGMASLAGRIMKMKEIDIRTALLLSSLIPFTLYFFAFKSGRDRDIALFLPYYLLICSYGIDRMAAYISRRTALSGKVAAAALLLIILIQIPLIGTIVNTTAGSKNAAEWLRRRDVKEIAIELADTYFFLYGIREFYVSDYPGFDAIRLSDLGKKVEYLVLSRADETPESWNVVSRKYRGYFEKTPPEAVFNSNDMDTRKTFLYFLNPLLAFKNGFNLRKEDSWFRIYRIVDFEKFSQNDIHKHS